MDNKVLRMTLAVAVLLVVEGRGQCGEAGSGSRLPAAARSRYLLLDSRLIDRLENARLALGRIQKHPANPLFGEDKPWEPRFDNLYANVVYDDHDKLFKCWYSPFIVDKAVSETAREDRSKVRYRPTVREMGVCYAVSKDGLAWEKPVLGLVEFQGDKSNNLVVRGAHGAGVFRDEREPDPQRRYKMIYQGMAVRFSPDGLRWSDATPCKEIAARGDTHNNALWSPELNRYVGITRLYLGQRIVGRTESADFIHWGKAAEVLRGDAHNQTYAMPIFRYADVYLGLVMILRRNDDRVHCELTWSPDTVRWERIEPGKALIPPSETRGAYDWGCVYAAALPVLRGGEIRIYYGGSNGPHGNWREGFFCLATLRSDGFAGYEAVDPARPAVIVTQPVPWPGRPLSITADAAGGSLRVELLDAESRPLAISEPISEDVTDGLVKVPQEVIAAQAGNRVRLRIEMRQAKTYSFAFGARAWETGYQ